MDSNEKVARFAGVLYLIVVVSGIFSLLYVQGKLLVWNDAAATFKNITASQMLFRYGIVSSIICYIAFLLLPLVLYRLLKPVNEIYATAMVALALASVPISFMNISHEFDVLTLISKAPYLEVFSVEQLQTQVLLHIQSYGNGVQIASIFWGLWLFPFGYLVFRSGFIPKIFGVLLMAGCFGYLIDFVGSFLVPSYNTWGISSYVTMPSAFGEIGTCLWLLIKGVKNDRIHA